MRSFKEPLLNQPERSGGLSLNGVGLNADTVQLKGLTVLHPVTGPLMQGAHQPSEIQAGNIHRSVPITIHKPYIKSC